MDDLTLSAASDAISQALTFSLSRQYLDMPLDEARYMQPVKLLGESAALPPVLARLDQIGNAVGGTAQPFVALQTALTACHNPGRHTLVFIIDSDGQTNHIYLGVRPHDADAAGEPARAFVEHLGQFLRGNWPGTRLTPCDFATEIHPRLTAALGHGQRRPFVTALTGIPSLKPGDQPGYPQSLDRLLRGLRGQPFSYIVLAEPMSEAAVNDIIRNCRDLLGHVHLMTRLSLTETQTEGTSETLGRTRTTGDSMAHQTGSSTSKSTQRGLNLQVGMGLLANIFPPAMFFAALGPNLSRSRSTTESHAVTHTHNWSESVAQTFGHTSSVAQAAGREYINAHAQAAEEQLRAHIARFEQAGTLGCWRVGVFFVAEHEQTAEQGAAQLRALLSGGKSAFEPIRMHDLSRLGRGQTERLRHVQTALETLKPLPLRLVDPTDYRQRIAHPLGPAFEGLETPINTEELSLLVNLPRREVPGVKLMATADFSLNPPLEQGGDIELGAILEGGEATPLTYAFSLDTLVRHCLLTGATGSGKTTTCHRLMAEVLQRHMQRQIPILVLEPAKDEYVQWAIEWNRQCRERGQSHLPTFDIYMPGEQEHYGQALHQLSLNPFQPADFQAEAGQRIDMESRCERFTALLMASLPMADVLPLLLEEAIFEYMRQHVPGFGQGEVVALNRYPHLRGIIPAAAKIIANRGYEERIRQNLTAAVKTRIEALSRGKRGTIFNVDRSTPYEALFERPVVINLSRINDDRDKALLMALLLMSLYEYRASRFQKDAQYRESLRGDRLCHLTIVEEAHRLLANPQTDIAGIGNPQAVVAGMFSEMLSEIRAYGQGLLIVDQVPSRLIPDAIKNTNLKIVHRQIARDDRSVMAGCMSLRPDQEEVLGTLRKGEVVIRGDLDDAACWVKVSKELRRAVG